MGGARIGAIYYVSAALAAVVVVCVITLVVLFVGQDGSAGDRFRAMFAGSGDAASAQAVSSTAARNQVIAAADQFVLRSNTYGPHFLNSQNKMPSYIAQVHAVTTPKLQENFDRSVVIAEAQVSQQGIARNVDLFATGVSSLTADNATVLVTGELDQSAANPQHPKAVKQRTQYQPVPFRFIVSLVKIDGEWLTDDFAPATGASGSFLGSGSATASPSAAASASPTQASSAQPGAGASSGTAGR